MLGAPEEVPDRRDQAKEQAEDRFKLRLRIVTVVVLGALLVFVTAADTLGRLFINPTFHVDQVVWGSLIGAFLISAGVAGVSSLRLPGGWEVRKSGPDGTK